MARDLEVDLEPLEAEVALLKLQEAISNQVIKDYQSLLTYLEKDLKTLKARASRLGSAEKLVGMQEAKVKRLSSKITGLRASRDQLRTAKSEAAERLSSCEKKHRENSETLTKMKDNITRLESECRNLTSAKKEAEKAVSESKRTAQLNPNALNLLEKLLGDKLQALGLKEDELKNMSKDRDKTAGVVKSLKEKMEEAKLDVARQDQKRGDADDQLKAKQDKLAIAQQELANSIQVLAQLIADSPVSGPKAVDHLKDLMAKSKKEGEKAFRNKKPLELNLKKKKEEVKRLRKKAATALDADKKRR